MNLPFLKCSSMGRITSRHAERGKIIQGNVFYLTLLRAVRNKNIHLKVPLSFYCSRLKLRGSDLVPLHPAGPQTTETSVKDSSNRVGHIQGQTWRWAWSDPINYLLSSTEAGGVTQCPKRGDRSKMHASSLGFNT